MTTPYEILKGTECGELITFPPFILTYRLYM